MTDILPNPRGFLSSSSRDADIAAAVVAAFDARGFPCFHAPRDVPAGSNYKSEIMLAIRDCTVFVVLLSPVALESVHVSREVTKAVEKDKRILPFALPGVSPGDFDGDDEWSYLFSGVQVVRYFSPDRVADAVLRAEPTARGSRPPLPQPEQYDGWPTGSVERFIGVVKSIVRQRDTVTTEEYGQLVEIARAVESTWLTNENLNRFVTTCLHRAGITPPWVSQGKLPAAPIGVDDTPRFPAKGIPIPHERLESIADEFIDQTGAPARKRRVEQLSDGLSGRRPQFPAPADARGPDDGDAAARGPAACDAVLVSLIEILAPVMNKHWQEACSATDRSFDSLLKMSAKNLRSWEDLGGRTKGGRTGRAYAGSGGARALAIEMENHRRSCSQSTPNTSRPSSVYADTVTTDLIDASDTAANQLKPISVEMLRTAKKMLVAHVQRQSSACEHEQRALVALAGYVLTFIINGRK